MADFNRFFPILLAHEGGFVNHPADPGGPTNKGITLATFTHCARELLGVTPTMEALRKLTDAQAAIIYKTLYWDVIRGDEIASQGLANIVCDFQVNAGSRAAQLLQSVLNDMGARPRLTVDGLIGRRTIAAIALVDVTRLHALYKERRIAYYRELARRRPSLARFLRGWLARTHSFSDAAVEGQGA
jgi:lysozyme family protein